jgi:hypothetical protein
LILWHNLLCEEEKIIKQAGADLCQVQEKLGLANPALPVIIFNLKDTEVFFHKQQIVIG